MNTLLQDIKRWRRYFHMYPELGAQEFKTAAYIQQELKKMKVPSRRVPPTGIIATLKRGSGRCIALRADMDALPVEEKSRCAFRSKTRGIMHACGHDAHMAMLLGAAQLLRQNDRWQGTVQFFFQPNEEGAGGALSLIQAGALQRPKVDAVFGLHVNPRLAAGAVGTKAGALMAAVDRFAITISGTGGHAAYPHEGVDPIPVAAEFIQAVQTLVSRKTSPVDPAVLTIGTIAGGRRDNVLAESVHITGTVRTLSEKTHEQIPRWIQSLLRGLESAHDVKTNLEYEVQASVLNNDPRMADLALRAAKKITRSVEVLETATMGGEDFAEYLKKVPGCFIYVGTGSADKKRLIPWHHPRFDVDESALPVGARLFEQITLDFLS